VGNFKKIKIIMSEIGLKSCYKLNKKIKRDFTKKCKM